ncbi:MAG: RluA family pseudouridine synthase [Holosporales bacterium]|nr:RluA family pseudouridine synthase [Holosporales bacterium]
MRKRISHITEETGNFEDIDNTQSTYFDSSRLDKYIKRVYGKLIPQSIIEKAIRNKDILVNGRKTKSSEQITNKDEIFVHPTICRIFSNISSGKKSSSTITHPEFAEQFKKMIVYESDDIIVINKPPGLASQLGSKIKSAVDIFAKEYNPEARLVHRIDKDTSGIAVLAKNIATARYMLHLFRSKKVYKKYYALICGDLPGFAGEISKPLNKAKDSVVVDFKNGKEAITKFKIIKRLGGKKTLVEVMPLTGRTHQIRVHMASINCPIVGDAKYGGPYFQRLCLHAYEISFPTREGKLFTKKAEVPEYFR